MKERLAERERRGMAVKPRVNRPAAEVVGERGGRDDNGIGSQRLEESRRPEVARLFLAQPGRVAVAGLEQFLLAADEFRRVVGNGVHVAAVAGERLGFAGIADGKQVLSSAASFLAVLLGGGAGGGFVIAFARVERLVRDALWENAEIEHANERVAAADAVVEKREGLAGGVAFQPERDAAEVHGERVAVHAVDAMADDIADGFADALRGGFVLAGAEFGEFLADAPGGGEQHVPRTASDVYDLEREQRGLLVLRARAIAFVRNGSSGKALANDGHERAFDEFVHQFRRRVKRAGCFAFRAEDKIEVQQRGGISGNVGMKFEQAFIDRAKFLDIQGGVVDAARGCALAFLVVGEIPERSEQVAVAQGATVERLRSKQFAIERREIENFCELVVAEKFPESAQAQPEVGVIRPRRLRRRASGGDGRCCNNRDRRDWG